MLTEFGGIAVRARGPESEIWGYTLSETTRDLERRYCALLSAVQRIELFAGFCYTQFADTYQEANGLLCADRTPKVPLARIAALNGLGPPTPHDDHGEHGQEV